MSVLPSPAELQYFIEVSSTLNISRAAERLGISQPTLSLAIQRLEGSFGVPLLIRSKSGVQLTQAGQKLVAQARELVAEWERIRGNALKDDNEIGGRYTIGCHPSVALYSLPYFLPGLLARHTALDIKLVHDLSRRITEDVVSFKIDFGIVVNPIEHPDLVIKLLCTDEVSLWGMPESKNREVLICDPDLIQTQALLKLLAKKGLHFKRVIPSSSLEVVTALTAAGAGAGILPARVASRISSLALKRLSDLKFHDRICLVYRADAQRSKASRLIAKVIEENIRKMC